jgi:cholesterol oxidase
MDSILATHWGDRQAKYDVVVIGSGYGGAITAARLSNVARNPKLSVCLLERGQEWPVGQFPDGLAGVLGNAYNPDLNPLHDFVRCFTG